MPRNVTLVKSNKFQALYQSYLANSSDGVHGRFNDNYVSERLRELLNFLIKSSKRRYAKNNHEDKQSM